MKATLTNLNRCSIPVTSAEGAGLAVSLAPGADYVLDDPAITTVVVGDDRAVTEAPAGEPATVLDHLKQLVMFWRARVPPENTARRHVVLLKIVAGEGDTILVTTDNPDSVYTMAPGTRYDVKADHFVKLQPPTP